MRHLPPIFNPVEIIIRRIFDRRERQADTIRYKMTKRSQESPEYQCRRQSADGSFPNRQLTKIPNYPKGNLRSSYSTGLVTWTSAFLPPHSIIPSSHHPIIPLSHYPHHPYSAIRLHFTYITGTPRNPSQSRNPDLMIPPRRSPAFPPRCNNRIS